jgi:hypothetical protein
LGSGLGMLNTLGIMSLLEELRNKSGTCVDCGSVIDFIEKQAESKTHRKVLITIKKILKQPHQQKPLINKRIMLSLINILSQNMIKHPI